MAPETITRLEKMVRDDVGSPASVASRLRSLVEETERLEAILETREEKFYDLVRWTAQTTHQAHHTDEESSRVTWQHCKKGVCAGIQASLRELGYEIE